MAPEAVKTVVLHPLHEVELETTYFGIVWVELPSHNIHHNLFPQIGDLCWFCYMGLLLGVTESCFVVRAPCKDGGSGEVFVEFLPSFLSQRLCWEAKGRSGSFPPVNFILCKGMESFLREYEL